MTELLDHLEAPLGARAGTLTCPRLRPRGAPRRGRERRAGPATSLPAGRARFGPVLRPRPRRGPRSPADAAADLRAAGFSRILVGDETRRRSRRAGSNLPKKGRILVAVDRLVAGPRPPRGRLVESLETGLPRGAPGAWGIRVLSADGRPGEDRLYLRRAPLPLLATARFREPGREPLLVQQPPRRVPRVPRLRPHRRHRLGPSSSPAPSKSLRGGAVVPLEDPRPPRTTRRRRCSRGRRGRGYPARRAPGLALSDAQRPRGCSTATATGDGVEAWFPLARDEVVQGPRSAFLLSRLPRLPAVRLPAAGRGSPRRAARGGSEGGRSPRSRRCPSATARPVLRRARSPRLRGAAEDRRSAGRRLLLAEIRSRLEVLRRLRASPTSRLEPPGPARSPAARRSAST